MIKKAVIAALIVVTAAFVFVYRKMGPPLPSSYQFSSVSPDKKYQIDVYSDSVSAPSAMPGQGGAGSRPATIILRNGWGWKIGSSDGCEILLDSVAIKWDYENDSVIIAKARSIDLNTGQCAE